MRQYPFTIILKEHVGEAEPKPLRIKIDPGSRTTGIAITDDNTGETVFAMELEHRGQQTMNDLESRRAIRRCRRNRKTRYRKPRFNNRTRQNGWLPTVTKEPGSQYQYLGQPVVSILQYSGNINGTCQIRYTKD